LLPLFDPGVKLLPLTKIFESNEELLLDPSPEQLENNSIITPKLKIKFFIFLINLFKYKYDKINLT
jgi:hypothetical protein